ncbi:terpene cyclase [Streptomyces sp. NPDC048416]|uniref:terpene synthase family protein n=1 Tax=Streptomyces sp. NPDC048416 TaxID=3365546 RepID=UPI00371A0A7F
MPQDIDFDLPAPARISPDLDRARRHNSAWVRRLGLVTDDRSAAWYDSWDMPRLAALGLPHAVGPALELCADAMAFFFVFDDQFDGPLGRDPARVSRVCQQLIDIVHGAAPPADADPCTAAFADIRVRETCGARPAWIARTAHEWEYYFAAQAHEAIGRLRGTPSDLETYLQVRRGIAGTDLPLSLGERAADIAVPAAAFHSPQLRIMRQAAIDVTLMCNDVYSVEKEESRGDMDNLVLVLESTRLLSRDAAVLAVRQQVGRLVGRFRELEGHVPALCAHLGLGPAERSAVHTYTEIMSLWMSGYHAWQTETLRYRTAPEIVPASGPGYLDQVLRTQPANAPGRHAP